MGVPAIAGASVDAASVTAAHLADPGARAGMARYGAGLMILSWTMLASVIVVAYIYLDALDTLHQFRPGSEAKPTTLGNVLLAGGRSRRRPGPGATGRRARVTAGRRGLAWFSGGCSPLPEWPQRGRVREPEGAVAAPCLCQRDEPVHPLSRLAHGGRAANRHNRAGSHVQGPNRRARVRDPGGRLVAVVRGDRRGGHDPACCGDQLSLRRSMSTGARVGQRT